VVKRKILIHAGPAKTGTTSIQSAFFQHSRAMLDLGYLYPRVMENHVFLSSCFMANPGELNVHRRARRTAEQIACYNSLKLGSFEKELACTQVWHTLILSSEWLGYLSAEERGELVRYLSRWSDDVRVILFARHPVAQSLSIMNEQVKGGAVRIEEFCRNPFIFPYRAEVEKWWSCLPRENVLVWRYPGDRPSRGDVVREFLDNIGATDLRERFADVKLPRANKALSWPALLLADSLTARYPIYGDRAMVSYLSEVEGPSYRPNAGLLERIAAGSADQVAFLEETYGIGFDSLLDQKGDPSDADRSPFDADAIQSLAVLLNRLAARGNTPEQESTISGNGGTKATIRQRLAVIAHRTGHLLGVRLK
jgi:hypothetical protein